MSADGNESVAVASNGGIWISQTINNSKPQLSVVFKNTSLVISWLIPSTNFVLQQSFDLANWSFVTNVPVLNLTNLQNQVTVPLLAKD